MTIQKMIELLNIEIECIKIANNKNCNRDCAKCNLVQDTDELLTMYNEVIYKLEMIDDIQKQYKQVVNELSSSEKENDKLRKELKKRRKEKKKWKRRALAYKTGLDNVRVLLEQRKEIDKLRGIKDEFKRF